MFDHDIDVGGSGISGFYDAMMSYVKADAYDLTLVLLAWGWVAAWPTGFIGFPIWGFVTVTLLLKLLLLRWTLSFVPDLWEIRRHWKVWRRLEAQKPSWVTRNHHRFRVLFYWRKDGRLELDGSTRAQRSSEEIKVLRNRNTKLRDQKFLYFKPVRNLVFILVAFALLRLFGTPLVASYLASNGGHFVPHDIAQWFWINLPWSGYAILLAQGQSFFGRFGVEEMVVAWWCGTAILPILIKHAILLWERKVYLSGAQFIPGARVLDPVEDEISMETMKDEMVHGSIAFVSPAAAARLMSG